MDGLNGIACIGGNNQHNRPIMYGLRSRHIILAGGGNILGLEFGGDHEGGGVNLFQTLKGSDLFFLINILKKCCFHKKKIEFVYIKYVLWHEVLNFFTFEGRLNFYAHKKEVVIFVESPSSIKWPLPYTSMLAYLYSNLLIM